MNIAVHDKTFRVDEKGHADFWVSVRNGTWESSTYSIFDRFLDAGRAYLDIGAWIGATVLYGCQRARVVYAFEPDPLAFAELQKNVELNEALSGRVVLINACLARDSGEVAFGSRGSGNDSTSSLLFGNKKTHWTVKALSFDDFARQHDIRDCNFIKMDIEGGEYQLLPTMEQYLNDHRPTLHLSLHPLYLKLKPLGEPGAKIARYRATSRILRSTACYKHRYDHTGRELTPQDILRACLGKIAMDVVFTDLPWPEG